MDDDLLNYLDTLSRGDCYHVDAVLKESAQETTERVFLITANGSERGPFIRKLISLDSGLGEAYERLWEAQQAGKRFMHLPRLLECGVEGDYRSVVMEYVEGVTLDEVVMSSEYAQQQASTIAVLLCDAVMELHENFAPALIHRDLKPSNVIVSASNLTLIDLGIARTFDASASVDTRSFGTRGYAPPEQFGYGQTDERSDVYALGLLIAFCFLGEEPSRALIDTGFADSRIPEALRPVLVKATAFDPADRYGSVRELKDDPAMAQLVTEVFADSEMSAQQAETKQAEACGVGDSACSPGPSAPSAPESSRRAVSSYVPRWLGIVWNIALIAVWIMFVAAAVSLTFSPASTDTFASPVARALCNGGICIGLGIIGYALMDRRALRARSIGLMRFPWYGESAVCIGVGLAPMVLFVILGASPDPFLV